ncbi:MAG: hypothetical protein ACI3ZP_03890 [Candidatus Cryptobacteroides sp.]
MEPKHSSQEVAHNIKNLFKRYGKQLNDFAQDNEITSTQIYAILNGEKYINAAWAVKFNLEFGIRVMYCMNGNLPIMDPICEYRKLLYASAAYKEAVEAEDKVRDEFELGREKLGPAEKATYIKAITEAHKNRIIESAKLTVILKEGWDLNTDDSQSINTPETLPELKLHEAIELVIKEAGRPLTFTEIAKQINVRNLYTRKDGKLVPASQISARIINYPQQFTVNRNESPATVSIAQ